MSENNNTSEARQRADKPLPFEQNEGEKKQKWSRRGRRIAKGIALIASIIKIIEWLKIRP